MARSTKTVETRKCTHPMVMAHDIWPTWLCVPCGARFPLDQPPEGALDLETMDETTGKMTAAQPWRLDGDYLVRP